MTPITYIFMGISVVLVFLLNFLLRKTHRLVSENYSLASKNRDLNLQIEMFTLGLTLEKAAPQLPSFDDKTSKLLKLALNNPNENEAKNAALQACRRISEQLK